MSAAAARRRKQLLAKKKSSGVGGSEGGEEGEDAVIVRLNELLAKSSEAESSEDAEALAYEGLQLAQSQVRKYVKNVNGLGAFDMASKVCIKLLNSTYVGMASQLSTQMIDAMIETHTVVTNHILDEMKHINKAYTDALEEKKKLIPPAPQAPPTSTSGSNDKKKNNKNGGGKVDDDEEMMLSPEEETYERLTRLHVTFLRKVIKYTDMLGTERYGNRSIHSLLGQVCWNIHEYEEGVMHFCLAEQPEELATLLLTTLDELPPNPSKASAFPAAERDALLTRGVLYLLAVENMKDANLLVQKFIELDEGRDPASLAKRFLDKTNKFQTHTTFCISLLQICETEAAPLYQWLLRAFNKELSHVRMNDLQPHTTKIGRIYFNIEPPPSMMSMMENMMGMMGGGGMGGMGGGGAGGINPALMAQMMGGGGAPGGRPY